MLFLVLWLAVSACVKEKLFTRPSLKLARQILFELLQWGKRSHYRIGLNSEYSKDSWRFIAMNSMNGSVDGKLLRET